MQGHCDTLPKQPHLATGAILCIAIAPQMTDGVGEGLLTWCFVVPAVLNALPRSCYASVPNKYFLGQQLRGFAALPMRPSLSHIKVGGLNSTGTRLLCAVGQSLALDPPTTMALIALGYSLPQ